MPLATVSTTATAMPRRKSPAINTSQVHNRLLAFMAHTSRYAFDGGSRLAEDAGVSRSSVNRLLNGQCSPSFALVSAVTRTLEKHLQGGLQGKRLDPHELISLDGNYPTPSACELAGCKGCLPAEAYDEHNKLKPAFKGVKPGQWSVAPTVCSTAKTQEKAKEAL